MKDRLIRPEDKLAINRRAKAAPAKRVSAMEPLFGQTPFNMMRRFTNDMERVFDTFNAFGLSPRLENDLLDLPRAVDLLEFPQLAEMEKAAWWPEIEVIAKNGELKIHADLPGMKKDDINVEFTNNALIISGERTQDTDEERDGFYHTERNYGSFYRTIPLPEGANLERANAVFHDGVLEVTVAVPKTQTEGTQARDHRKSTEDPR